MTTFDWLLASYAVFFSSVWCVVYILGLAKIGRLTTLGSLHPPEPPTWPKLSVIVPACNEAMTIASALDSLRAVDYPALEIVLVDDRSTDGTGAIIDDLASRDPRIVPIHVKELPAGWLGKVHALHVGTKASSGEWLLYTDADVHFRSDTLNRAVAHAVHQNLGHLAVLPDLSVRPFWLQATLAVFGFTFFLTTRVDKVGKPGSKAFVGIGAFNLVRRKAFERTPGFEWLKMEVADDVGLGLMLHRAKEPAAFVVGQDMLRVTWYPTLSTMIRGLEKNTFGPLANYSYLRLLPQLGLMTAFAIAPFVALAAGPLPVVRVAGALAIASCFIFYTRAHARLHVEWLPSLFAPIGLLIIIWIFFRSAFMCLIHGGVRWRGTLYSVSELKAGRRLDMSGVAHEAK